MAYSSILGAGKAPIQASGRDSDLLGPSDNSDSGSDAMGTSENHADSDAGGTGERGAVAGVDAEIGADIMPDRIITAGRSVSDGDVNVDEVDDLTDLDAEEDEDDPDSNPAQ